MNKVDTAKIKASFVRNVDAKEAWLHRLETLITPTPSALTDLNVLCENFLTSTYVDFECLVSDLFHGYINNDNSKYVSYLDSNIKNSITAKFGAWHASHTVFSAPKHIVAKDLRALLDPTDWNITFKNVSAMNARASDWLTSANASKFLAISAADSALLDAAHALRNFISHNSKSARTIMNARLKAIVTAPGCVNAGLEVIGNDTSLAGKYLRAQTNGTMRAAVYSQRIKIIGSSL